MKKWDRVATIELAAAGIYSCVAWLLIQIASQILPFFDIPVWVMRLFIVLLLLGLPVTLILAWFPISRWVDSREPEKSGSAPSPSPTVAQGSAVASSETDPVSQVRPWARYCARLIDIFIFALCLGVIFAIIAPGVLTAHDNLFGLLSLFLWCFVEAMCLSIWGTTPGKGLLRVSVRNADGSKLNYRSALSRSVDVWIRGLGIGFPLVSVITLIVAYQKLTKNGITTWDQSRDFSVTHKEIGRARVIVALLLFAVFISLMVFGIITSLTSPEAV
jgi:hypothetical protein